MTQIQKMLDKLPDLRYDKCMKSIVSETKAFRWYILCVIVIKYITWRQRKGAFPAIVFFILGGYLSCRKMLRNTLRVMSLMMK